MFKNIHYREEIYNYTVSADDPNDFSDYYMSQELKSLPILVLNEPERGKNGVYSYMVYNEENGLWEINKEEAFSFIKEHVVKNSIKVLEEKYCKGAISRGFFEESKKILSAKRFASSFLRNYSRIVTKDELNPYSELLCLKNNVIDLKTKKLLDFDKKYLMTEKLNLNYCDYKTNSKEISEFFQMFHNNELEYIQKVMGHGLLGEQVSNQVNVFYSKKDYNKDMIIDLIYKTSPNSYRGTKEFFINDREVSKSRVLRRRTIVLEIPNKTLEYTLPKIIGNRIVPISEPHRHGTTINPISSIYAISNTIPRTNLKAESGVNRFTIIKVRNNNIDSTCVNNVDFLQELLSWRIHGAYTILNNPSSMEYSNTPNSIKSHNKKIQESILNS